MWYNGKLGVGGKPKTAARFIGIVVLMRTGSMYKEGHVR
jgi:hypothetical protein